MQSELVMSGERASVDRAALTAALQRVAKGDKSALKEVYDRTSAKLYGVALRIFPEPQDAQDVLQDAYLNVWQKAASFDPERASPITWLVTLTRNRAIDRARQSGKVRHEAIEIAQEVADGAPDAEACLIAADGEARVQICLKALPEGERTMVRTAFFDGSTYSELASRSGIPLGTVKTRMRRALARLRECLQ